MAHRKSLEDFFFLAFESGIVLPEKKSGSDESGFCVEQLILRQPPFFPKGFLKSTRLFWFFEEYTC